MAIVEVELLRLDAGFLQGVKKAKVAKYLQDGQNPHVSPSCRDESVLPGPPKVGH